MICRAIPTLFLFSLPTLFACGVTVSDGDDIPVEGFEISGSVVASTGASFPSEADVYFVWWLNDGEEVDYVYGSGSSSEGTFDATIPADFPESLSGAGMNLSQLYLFSSDTDLPEGELSSAEMEESIGFSARYAVVYRMEYAAFEEVPWLEDFPPGFSCGECVSSEEGFDSFIPVDCSEIEIVVPADAEEECNYW